MSIDNPRVSIVFTSYNHDEYIVRSIESILNQSYTDFELIIIDDASTDSSQELILQYAAQDARIRPFFHEKNLGYSGFTKMLNLMKGEYIAIAHSDDAWAPDKLMKQISFLDDNREYAACFTDVTVIDDDDAPLLDHAYSSAFKIYEYNRYQWLRHFFYNGNAFCHPSLLIRKKAYDDFSLGAPGLSGLPDMLNWIKVLKHAEIKVLSDKLTYFRVHNNESNTSSISLPAQRRVETELYLILNEFLSITSLDDLQRIFPEADEYIVDGDGSSEYIWAMMAIKEGTRPQLRLFGMKVLYDLLRDKTQSSRLKKLYNFDGRAFTKLKCDYDTFPISSLAYCTVYFAEDFASFQEARSIRRHFQFNGAKKTIKIELTVNEDYVSENWRARFDPIEGSLVSCRIETACLNGVECSLRPINSSYTNSAKEDVFLTKDPSYCLDEVISSGDVIHITFTINEINYDEINTVFHDQQKRIKEMESKSLIKKAILNGLKCKASSLLTHK